MEISVDLGLRVNKQQHKPEISLEISDKLSSKEFGCGEIGSLFWFGLLVKILL